MTANPERGEVAISLQGVDYVMRPTYDAIVAVETTTGLSLIELGRAASDGSMKLSVAAEVAAEFIRAWGRAEPTVAPAGTGTAAFNATQVGKLAMAEPGGVMTLLRQLVLVLVYAAGGGYDASGNVLRVAGKN